MSLSEIVEILGVLIIENPITIKNKFHFQILFQLKENLKEKIRFKFIYIQPPLNEKRDEELENYEIPGNLIGKFKINFLVPPPTFFLEGLLKIFEITLLLVQFRIKEFEFIRVGYYVNTELNGPIEKDSGSNLYFKSKFTERNILTDEPRVTKFLCPFI